MAGRDELLALYEQMAVIRRTEKDAHDPAEDGIEAEVVDLCCLVPLDLSTVLSSHDRTLRLVTVEENPHQGGWGATLVSVVDDEGLGLLDAPGRRVAGECVPLPFADAPAEQIIPTADKAVAAVRNLAAY
ncbi:transketolase C-terminal domain-containing protein [Streptomyces fulvoviolaceus]|uniref:transketolase C-terminal domain-containing protein n=1 Tax=Streptomyces fulvoviolaceus TaxID=285535 RepID=UPI0009971D06|nr:transketolase C-terminal domain-containing protein [Streptomyces fulvoviolaceus]